MKKYSIFVLVLALVLSLTACSTSASTAVTFDVETGDKIKIEVNVKDGYSQTTDDPFVISKDDETILSGTFAYAEAYDLYYDYVTNDESASLLNEGTKDGNDYFFYSVTSDSGTEYDYFVKVANSDTAIAMGSLASQAEAEAAFDAITISLAD